MAAQVRVQGFASTIGINSECHFAHSLPLGDPPSMPSSEMCSSWPCAPPSPLACCARCAICCSCSAVRSCARPDMHIRVQGALWGELRHLLQMLCMQALRASGRAC